jgi:hypothetical protein
MVQIKPIDEIKQALSEKLREELVNAYSFAKYRDLAGRTIIEVNNLTQH